MTKELREKVWAAYNDCNCAYCGCEITFETMEVDHIEPTERCGKNDSLDNLVPSCRSCNRSKDTYLLEEFRDRLIEDVNRLRRDSAKFRILERFGLIKAVDKKLVFYFEQFTGHEIYNGDII